MSGSRTNLRPQPIIVSGDMSANITSDPIIMQSLSGMGFHITWSGTSPVGTMAVEVSNDYAIGATGEVQNVGTWVPVELSLAGSTVTSIPITGNTGKGFIDVEKTMAYAIRLFYDNTSGVGTMNAIANGKVS